MLEYRIERISEFNLGDLLPIYQSAFGNTLDLNVFKKKQSTQTFGDTYVGFIAYDNQHNPAAFYGVYTCEISYKGKIYRSAQSGDTMTHKDHGGKGLFTLLATKTYDYCKEQGFHCVFGFPNENSFPGFTKRLGWTHFDDLTPYVIRVKCIPWIRLKNTFRLPQSIHNNWCRKKLGKWKKGQPFKSSCYSVDTPVVNHSESFFTYKTYDENFLIDVKGISVWLKFDDTFLIIGDMEKCSEKEFINVIRKLKRIAFWMGLPHLRFHASSNSWGEEMFNKHGTPMDVTYPIGGINFSNEIPLEKMKFTAADNDTF
jgi:hypothetical protein